MYILIIEKIAFADGLDIGQGKRQERKGKEKRERGDEKRRKLLLKALEE